MIKMNGEEIDTSTIKIDSGTKAKFEKLGAFKAAGAASSNLQMNTDNSLTNLGLSISAPLMSSIDLETGKVEASNYIGTDSNFISKIGSFIQRKNIPESLTEEKTKLKVLMTAISDSNTGGNIGKTSLKSFAYNANDSSLLNNLKKIEGPLAIKKIPIQVKALMLSKFQESTADWTEDEDDLLNDTSTRTIIEENYTNIQQVKVFDGFEKINGLNNLNKIKWKLMDSDSFDGPKNKFCMLESYKNRSLGVGSPSPLPIYNQFFTIDGEDNEIETVPEGMSTDEIETVSVEIPDSYISSFGEYEYYTTNIVLQHPSYAGIGSAVTNMESIGTGITIVVAATPATTATSISAGSLASMVGNY
tara:strand:- start:239 stop:1318 length:1080 start_codon:yes stop_codon:yes gene_type:complete